jgi:hypothetical protein
MDISLYSFGNRIEEKQKYYSAYLEKINDVGANATPKERYKCASIH